MLMTMRHEMKQRYRVFRRSWGTYYCEDLVTEKQETLHTRDRDEAYRLVAALNENEVQSTFSRQLARVYWKAGDPAGATRTWQQIMDEIPKLKQNDETRRRWIMANKDKAFDWLQRAYADRSSSLAFIGVDPLFDPLRTDPRFTSLVSKIKAAAPR